jgi:hypothetical protein
MSDLIGNVVDRNDRIEKRDDHKNEKSQSEIVQGRIRGIQPPSTSRLLFADVESTRPNAVCYLGRS